MNYTETHEWVAVKDQVGTVGITMYAQRELGDIVYVELPQVGKVLKAGEEAVVLESTKAAADVYSPVSGTVIEINTQLKSDSGLINSAPETEGWLFKLRLEDANELKKMMDEQQYSEMIS